MGRQLTVVAYWNTLKCTAAKKDRRIHLLEEEEDIPSSGLLLFCLLQHWHRLVIKTVTTYPTSKGSFQAYTEEWMWRWPIIWTGCQQSLTVTVVHLYLWQLNPKQVNPSKPNLFVNATDLSLHSVTTLEYNHACETHSTTVTISRIAVINLFKICTCWSLGPQYFRCLSPSIFR
jgi:hypothetical protein